MHTITVDSSGTELAYMDSGEPLQSSVPYVTIFAIHGMTFGAHIFDRVRELAPMSQVRIVAIARRGYPGSTPTRPEELDDKEGYLRARGCEIATFIYKFIQAFKLQAVSADGTVGGVAVMGWSLGAAVALSVISHIDTYTEDVRICLRDHLRALIINDVPAIALGLPNAPAIWSPHYDKQLTANQAYRLEVVWLTSYFQHGELSSRSLDALEYVVPAIIRPPSVFAMTAQYDQIVFLDQGICDVMWFMGSGEQFKTSYMKACFDKSIRAMVPNMKVSALVGNSSLVYVITAGWHMEDDAATEGPGLVNVKWIPGANHFLHWDDPALAMKTYFECIYP